MKRSLIFILLLSASMGCKEKEFVSPEVAATPCVSAFKDLMRSGELVKAAPVVLINGRFYYSVQSDNFKIDIGDRVPFIPCNLPKKYQKDTLRVLISGYHLTNDFLEVANVIPLPFELTNIGLR